MDSTSRRELLERSLRDAATLLGHVPPSEEARRAGERLAALASKVEECGDGDRSTLTELINDVVRLNLDISRMCAQR